MSVICQLPRLELPRASAPVRALFVEDNQALLASVFTHLEERGFVLDAAPDGPSGLQLASSNDYDVVVLDWMLPRQDGIDVLRQMRGQGADVPVLMLTARDELDSKIAGFSAGADDYLAKPFAMVELEARLIALSMRRQGRKQVLRVHDLEFNLKTQEVQRAGRPVQLYHRCRMLLEALMRESPHVVTKEQLEFAIWADDRPDRDMLRMHVYELRKQLDRPGEPKLLHTLSRQGYRLALMEDDDTHTS